MSSSPIGSCLLNPSLPALDVLSLNPLRLNPFLLNPLRLTCTALIALVCAGGGTASAQIEFEQPPINYGKAPSHDPVTQLQERLKSGTAELRFDKEQGYLKSVLEQLEIEASSQVLVHSQTSFQLRKISPRRPRALYFNDESYVGWVQGGDVLEIMTTDPQQGAVFYTLDQTIHDKPQLIRDQGNCLTCHASSRTQNVPGGMVRSMFVDAGGQPHYGAGSFDTDHRSPFDQRWGGWYVTGTHGEMRHMGNVVSTSRLNPEEIDREAGANVTDLSQRFDVSPYLTPHSDIVALMVLEHQTQMQNLLTRANYENRQAAHYDSIMNKALDRPADYVSESTGRRVASVGDKLLRYLLFCDEFPLTAPVAGSSSFAADFQAKGIRDSQGRSLRDLDLNTRMFKYPCSYLIDSPSFDGLPGEVKRYVSQRLHRILTGEEDSEEFSHLTPADRQAILEILTETKPGLWAE